MRRFKFIGDPSIYIYVVPDRECIYDEDADFGTCSVLQVSKKYPNDWEEVFEVLLNHQKSFTTDSTKLHKDTDLGYYAGLAMQGLCSNGKFTEGVAYSPWLSELSVSIAQELIKQLNEETK